MATKTAKSAKQKNRSSKGSARGAGIDRKVSVSVYEVRRGLLTPDIQKQMKKLQTFYLSELVRVLNIDATMRSTASENTKIGAFVAKISKHLHDVVNKYHDAGVQAEGE